jgi:ribosomal protein S12 methylthiotransferase accessory factor YcaO
LKRLINILKIFTLKVITILFIVFTGCSSNGSIASIKQHVEMGQSRETIKKILGNPDDIQKESSVHKWYYRTSESIKILFFEDDRLTIIYDREF